MVQDPFQLDSCVTSAYMSTAWRHWCNNASRIASKWMENGKGGLISEGIFNLLPSSKKLNDITILDFFSHNLVSCAMNPESTNTYYFLLVLRRYKFTLFFVKIDSYSGIFYIF